MYSYACATRMEQDEQLIDIVKAYPCLYDTKSANFKIALKKENALLERYFALRLFGDAFFIFGGELTRA